MSASVQRIPTISLHQSTHEYLADVISLSEKATDPLFQVKTAIRHHEDRYNAVMEQWTASLVHMFSLQMSFANTSVRDFQSCICSLIGITHQEIGRVLDAQQSILHEMSSPRRFVRSKSEDGKVVSVRFPR